MDRAPAHPSAGRRASLTVTPHQWRHADNVVPDACDLLLDRRMVPGEDEDAVKAEIADLSRVPAKRFGVRAEIVEYKADDRGRDRDRARSPRSCVRALRRPPAWRRKARPLGFQGGCDLVHFRHVGAQGTVIGPGSLAVAHKPDEFVPVDEFIAASLIYRDVARSHAGGDGRGASDACLAALARICTMAAGLVLHTAASGSIAALDAHLPAARRWRHDAVSAKCATNIAYLNGLLGAAGRVRRRSRWPALDWTRDPADLIAAMVRMPARAVDRARACADRHARCMISSPARTPDRCRLARRLAGAAKGSGARPIRPCSVSVERHFLATGAGLCRARLPRPQGAGRRSRLRRGSARVCRCCARISATQVKIAADANGGGNRGSASRNLDALAVYDLAYVEQPVPAGDWDAVDCLAGRSPLPMMLDESVATPDDIARILRLWRTRSWRTSNWSSSAASRRRIAAARRLSGAGVPVHDRPDERRRRRDGRSTPRGLRDIAGFAELYGADGLIDDPVSGVSYAGGHRAHGPRIWPWRRFRPCAATHLIGEFA